MKKPLTSVNIFAIILGAFFLIEGIWGMFSDVVLGSLTTNRLHAFIHLLLGVNCIYFGMRNRARKFILFVGVLLLVVGTCFFLPTVDKLVMDIFAVNKNVAYLNIIVGILSILIAVFSPKRKVDVSHSHHAH